MTRFKKKQKTLHLLLVADKYPLLFFFLSRFMLFFTHSAQTHTCETDPQTVVRFGSERLFFMLSKEERGRGKKQKLNREVRP